MRRVGGLDAQTQLEEAGGSGVQFEPFQEERAHALSSMTVVERDHQLGRLCIDEPVTMIVNGEQPAKRGSHRDSRELGHGGQIAGAPQFA
jgi:hypothetical protein